jgi:hypothetical protein
MKSREDIIGRERSEEESMKEVLVKFINWGYRNGHVTNYPASNFLTMGNKNLTHRTTTQMVEDYLKIKA